MGFVGIKLAILSCMAFNSVQKKDEKADFEWWLPENLTIKVYDVIQFLTARGYQPPNAACKETCTFGNAVAR